MAATPPEPPGFSQPAQLRDGTPVCVRAVRPDDRQRIIDAFHKLAPETVYTRFFSAKKELSEADLGRIEASDFVRAVSLVVTLGQGADEVIIGGGSYTVLDHPGEPSTAEVSFTVEEDYQGQGLSTLLMRLLVQIGRERGIHRFEAEVLAGNTPMLKVFERCGLPMVSRLDDGVMHVMLSLDAPAAAAPGG
jgi:RimJ/RimL family protein N-acetyltransferase